MKTRMLHMSLLLALPILTGCATIPAGHKGVVTHWGDAIGEVEPGLTWYNCFSKDIVQMDCRTLKVDQQCDSASKDLQTVHTTVTLNYNIDPENALEFYKRLGYSTVTDVLLDNKGKKAGTETAHSYVRKIIRPRIDEVVKASTAKFKANELIEQREDVKKQVEVLLIERLAQYHIIVVPNDVNLTDFSFSPEYDKAIEAKQVAEQKAEQAQYELQEAEVKAQEKIVQAQAEAKANQMIAASLTSPLIKKIFLETWDGKYPKVTGGGGTILQVPGQDVFGGE